jgi:hypothetical protein
MRCRRPGSCRPFPGVVVAIAAVLWFSPFRTSSAQEADHAVERDTRKSGSEAARGSDERVREDDEASQASSIPDAIVQTPSVKDAALKRRIEETWRVVPLQRGVLLVPRRSSMPIKGVELGERGVAVDGQPVTGPELVARLGADAESVLQLSYVPTDERIELFTRTEQALERARERRRAAREATAGPPPDLRFGRSGARVRVFGNVSVREGEQVGDVVAVFGSVDMRGAAHGNVVAILGDVDMGPKATASGDVVAIGGKLRSAAGALASGKLTEVRIGWPEIDVTVPGDDRFSMRITPDWRRIARGTWYSGLVGSLLLLAVCVFTVILAPSSVTDAADPGRSLFVSWLAGLAVQVLLVPAVVLVATALAVSVVGIPLLALIPVLLFFLLLAALVGFTSIAARVGSVWLPNGQVSASVLAVVLGLGMIWATGLTGRYMWAASGGSSPWGVVLLVAGLGIEYTCWTMGLGSAVMAWKQRRARRKLAATPVVTPPPIPVDV